MRAASDEEETLVLKRVQSVDERYPFWVPEDCAMVRTPPVKERGPEKEVPMTPPVELVERSAFWTFDMARFEEVALVEVELPVMLRLPFTVVEPTETKPPLKVRVVEVAFPMKGYAKTLAAVR